MGKAVNKYGLKRSSLTDEQRREIRKRAGFGCVKCGNAIGDYEHVDPEFHDAKVHDVDNMTFLCVGCHGSGTRRRLSKETIKRCMAKPAALQAGFAHHEFDVGIVRPDVKFGPIRAVRAQNLLRIDGVDVFSVNAPEEEGGPFRLNAEFRNRDGEIIFSIINNAWQVRTSNWDAISEGPVTTIRNGRGDIALSIRTLPPNEIRIERLNMSFGPVTIACDGQRLFSRTGEGRGVFCGGGTFTDCKCAVEFDTKKGNFILGVQCRSMHVVSMSTGVPSDIFPDRRGRMPPLTQGFPTKRQRPSPPVSRPSLLSSPAARPSPQSISAPDAPASEQLAGSVKSGALWDLVQSHLRKS